MPWNGTGTFKRIYSWVADAAAGISIQPPRIDADTGDIVSSGFGNSLTRDGQGIATANLPMAGFRHTGVGAGAAATDYAQMQQVANGLINWAAATGTGDGILATYSPIIPIQDGQLFYFRSNGTNATTSAFFAANGGLGEGIVKLGGASPIFPGDVIATAEMAVRYRSSSVQYELLNPQTANVIATRVAADFSVTSSVALTNVTGLSAAVPGGKKFHFEAYLTCTDAAAGGVKAAIAGTATVSSVIYDGYLIDTNTIKGQTNATALTTAVASSTTTATTGLVIIISGTATVTGAGTLTVQFAQNTSSGTASVVKRGSVFLVRDVT